MDAEIKEYLERLEARVRFLEQGVAGGRVAGVSVPELRPAEPGAGASETAASVREAEDRLEFQVGTVWFSRVGITVLALGAGIGISQPYPGLASYVPSLGGFFLVIALLFAAHRWRTALGPLAGFIRGGGLLLLYFSALRLYFFGSVPALEANTLTGMAVLVAAPAASFALALGYRSGYLSGIAVIAGLATALVVPVPWFSVVAILLILAAAACISVRMQRPWLLPWSAALGFAAFLLVMLDRPVLGQQIQWLIEPRASPVFVMAYVLVIALGSLFRSDNSGEPPSTVVTGAINSGLGLLAFFATTEAGGLGGIGVPYVGATLLLLAIATAFWIRERSRLSTFLYSMTGYLALTIGIMKFSGIPNVFVWLSMQSLIVVATAVWFQSRFIVSTNFLIYLATIIGYLSLAQAVSGISFVFGAVALGSARILAWQKSRLQIKTEFMRNGYLVCAFAAFPYALYHLVPRNYVSISWVGIAGFYYLMNLAVSSRKYRWMGHGTLLGTVIYLIVVGIIQLKPAYRILSFVVLGFALVCVSLVFSYLRGRRRDADGQAGEIASSEK